MIDTPYQLGTAVVFFFWMLYLLVGGHRKHLLMCEKQDTLMRHSRHLHRPELKHIYGVRGEVLKKECLGDENGEPHS